MINGHNFRVGGIGLICILHSFGEKDNEEKGFVNEKQQNFVGVS